MLDKVFLNIIIAVLMDVESDNNPNAIGDNGKAVGILQIHEICVDDVNRITKSNYTYDDRYNVTKSTVICANYLIYYHDKYVKWYEDNKMFIMHENGHKVEDYPHPSDVDEICARLWNGGYAGLKRNPRATDAYWEKVKKKLNVLRKHGISTQAPIID